MAIKLAAREGTLRTEGLRLSGAWAGLTLWFAYPFVLMRGSADAFRYRCRLERATPGHDPCFTDYLPIMEMLAFVVTIMLAYPFARFAFTLYSRPAGVRGAGWWFAGRQGGQGYYPSLQIAAGIGIAWGLLNARFYPLALYWYHAYWAGWLVWFMLGIWLSWPKEDPIATDDQSP